MSKERMPLLIIDRVPGHVNDLSRLVGAGGFAPVVWLPDEEDYLKLQRPYNRLELGSEQKFDHIWAHTSTNKWPLIVAAHASLGCHVTLYTSGSFVEEKDKAKVPDNLKGNITIITNIKEALRREEGLIIALKQFLDKPSQPFPVEEITRSYQLTTTLCILCQGYLCVYAALQSNAPRGDVQEIIPALVQMGWEKQADSQGNSNTQPALKIISALDAGSLFNNVSLASWWLTPLGLSENVTDPAYWEQFVQNIKAEWRIDKASSLPTPVESLLAKLKSNRPIDSPSEVAKLYCLITTKLGGRPC
jgi:hypothetical protein